METMETVVHVYVACTGDGTVEAMELDPDTGSLRPLGRRSGLESLRALALDAARGLLYAGRNTEPPVVETFGLQPDGSLEPLGAAPLGATTAYLAVDPLGLRLFSASYHQSRAAALPLAPDGTVAAGRYAVLEPGPLAHCVLPAPDGAFVYAASLGGDRIVWYRRGEERFAEAGSVAAPAGSGPRHLRFSASGDVLYVLHELSGHVAVYGRDAAGGGLVERQRISSIPERLGLVPGRARTPGVPDPGPDAIWCADLRLGAGGRFLYTTERSSSTLSAFAVDPADGTLRYLRTVDTEEQPRGAGTDPEGRCLLVCGERSGHLSAYRIDPDDGSLERTGRVATGKGPMWIETYGPGRRAS